LSNRSAIILIGTLGEIHLKSETDLNQEKTRKNQGDLHTQNNLIIGLQLSLVLGSFMSYSKERDWWIDFVSGLVGGLVSVTSCAPLDIARTRLNMMVGKYLKFLKSSLSGESMFDGFVFSCISF